MMMLISLAIFSGQLLPAEGNRREMIFHMMMLVIYNCVHILRKNMQNLKVDRK